MNKKIKVAIVSVALAAPMIVTNVALAVPDPYGKR